MSSWVRKKNGVEEWYYGSGSITTKDRIIINPTDEMLKEAGYKKYVPKAVKSEPVEPSETEKLEAEKRLCYERMKASDEHILKCMKLGLSFKDTYPNDEEEYRKARLRYNEIESLLSRLYVKADKRTTR